MYIYIYIVIIIYIYIYNNNEVHLCIYIYTGVLHERPVFRTLPNIKLMIYFCPIGSPFHVHITDEVNPQKVKCYGPGIEPKGVRRGQPGLFTVDASQAGVAPLEVLTTDAKGEDELIF